MHRNLYRHKFVSYCPNDGKPVSYEIEIISDEMILVETILSAVCIDCAFHEDIADRLAAALGGVQTLKAYHNGVYIETTRERNCGRLTKRVQIGSTVFEKGVEAKLAIAAVAK